MKTPGRRLRRVLNGGTDESGSTTSRTNVDPKLLTDPVARMKARPAPSLANARLIRGPQDLAGSAAGSWVTANGPILPDPNCTLAISRKVTQDALATTICRTGYTKSIRPPASITEIEKRENAAAYAYTGSLKDVEYDHLVPLELGGDSNDPRNLWIEPGASPNLKDGVESRLHELVCEGRVPLAAAQEAIATDWTTALETVR